MLYKVCLKKEKSTWASGYMLACVEPGPHLIPARPCPTNSPERGLSHTPSSAKAEYDLKTPSTARVLPFLIC